MAWSTPSSRTTGTLITAAIWNQDVVANPQAIYNVLDYMRIEALAGDRPTVYATGGENVSNGATQAVNFTAELIDTDSMLDTGGANPERITFTTAGLYLITYGLSWSPAASGESAAQIWHSVDGVISHCASTNAGVSSPRYAGAVIHDMLAAEYIEFRAWNNTGGAEDASTRLAAIWLGASS